MYDPEALRNPFTLDPSLKSLLTYKAQEKNNTVISEEHYDKPHDRLYYTSKSASHYGLIKKLEEQAMGLSDLRSQILTEKKTPKAKSVSSSEKKFSASAGKKTELPAIKQNRTQNISTQLTEKKETLREFLEKGKQMFLEKMMENMKREETLRLTEFIINEEETLNEHEADFREHVKFSNTFIQDLNKEAERVFNEAKDKAKEINKEKTKIAQLEQQIKTVESQIKKKEEDKEVYESYKKFCMELFQPAMRNLIRASKPAAAKKEDPSKFFLTQNAAGEEGGAGNKEGQEKEDGGIPPFTFEDPKQVIELLKRLDDATIFLIHNTQEKEEDMEKTKKIRDAQKEQINAKANGIKDSLTQVQKLCEKLEREKVEAINRLRQMEKAPQKNAADDGSIDKQKIIAQLKNMCEKLLDGKVARDLVQQGSNSDDALKMLELLERELDVSLKFYNETIASEANLKMLNEIENEIKKKKWTDNAKLKQEEEMLKNMQAQEKQKNKKVTIRTGRKPMNKILLEPNQKVEEKIDEDANKDDDEKYFSDNFTFMDGVKNKVPSTSSQEGKTTGR